MVSRDRAFRVTNMERYIPPVWVGSKNSVLWFCVCVCCFCCRSGEIEEAEAERLGLVPSHAYAVLDVKEINGTRLLQVW